MNKIKIVTHNGGFHADDVFAISFLRKFLEGDLEIIRSRDSNIIEGADYVVDVDFIYDPSKNRFDHHQTEGAGKRENGIPYASFGLLWKEYGEKFCESKKIADLVDQNLVTIIDAADNGFEIYDLKYRNIYPVDLNIIIAMFKPTILEEERSMDFSFEEAQKIAEIILERYIISAKTEIDTEEKILKLYEKTEDKRFIIVDENEKIDSFFAKKILSEKTDSLYLVMKPRDYNIWKIDAMYKGIFEPKKPFPESWAGKSGEELAQICKVRDALFCHRNRFVASAETQEGAISMVLKSLEN